MWITTFDVHKKNLIIPVDTGRKLNVHKTFRRRPGRLLNVLCTFNLPPVTTQITSGMSRFFAFNITRI